MRLPASGPPIACAAGGRLRRDGEGRLGARGREAAGADLKAVRAGDPVDVDRAGPGVAAPRHLRRAEVTAAGPRDPAAPVGDHRRGRQLGPVSLGPAGRPAARYAPGVEPADDRLDPDERAAGERLAGVAEHADLYADPALGVHVLRLGPDAAWCPVEVIGGAERAPGPQHRDELGHVAGQRVPDEMARPAFADQPLRGRLDGYRARGGTER